MTFNAKTALITGGSRGIGRGIALKLAAKGRRIAIHYYQNESAANDTAKKVRDRGADAVVIKADVCHPEQVSAMMERKRSRVAAGLVAGLLGGALGGWLGYQMYASLMDIAKPEWGFKRIIEGSTGAGQICRSRDEGGGDAEHCRTSPRRHGMERV